MPCQFNGESPSSPAAVRALAAPLRCCLPSKAHVSSSPAGVQKNRKKPCG